MNKIKRRGFVMTGGGAKGLYEADEIQAFHRTGPEFTARLIMFFGSG